MAEVTNDWSVDDPRWDEVAVKGARYLLTHGVPNLMELDKAGLFSTLVVLAAQLSDMRQQYEISMADWKARLDVLAHLASKGETSS